MTAFDSQQPFKTQFKLPDIGYSAFVSALQVTWYMTAGSALVQDIDSRAAQQPVQRCRRSATHGLALRPRQAADFGFGINSSVIDKSRLKNITSLPK